MQRRNEDVKEMLEPEKMNEFAGQVIKEILAENTKKLNRALAGQQGQAEKKEFLDCMNRLFTKCREEQEKGKKKPIRYVYLFYLNAALLTETYEIQINAFSEEAYLDQTECMQLWVPRLFVESFQSTFETLDRKVGREVIRYNSRMKMELKQKLFYIYLLFLQQFLMREIGEAEKLDSFQRMEKHETLQIVFGGYMSEGVLLWPKKREA